ncbi:MAG: class aldolase/adducin family protein [Deltaproteobacteria bacterium]|nr:class aldolase/adducin family protein [Deltaproteobacteria bacterium]
MDTIEQLKRDVIGASRILSQQKLVEGFGHVSARIADSDRFIITPRISLALVQESELLIMNANGEVAEGKHAAPIEALLHAAIMKAKPRVNAITRIHARVANIFSVTERKLEPVHSHGSFFAGGVPVYAKPDLILTAKLGSEVAQVLDDKPAVLLRGNGQVTVGRTIPEAVMMAIYLEEAAQILFGALQIGTPIPLTMDESKQRQVEALTPADMERAWNFFKSKIAND